jgi:AraC family transcriptional regulator, regulatory protein of adaptative response / methylated-DNA-[protein]-cysteine methyltransferase
MNISSTDAVPLTTNDTRWDGVLRKDAALDGQYLFAVKTTGIYCRPSCPSRTPKRTNSISTTLV